MRLLRLNGEAIPVSDTAAVMSTVRRVSIVFGTFFSCVTSE
jgi:hypothetical protein